MLALGLTANLGQLLSLWQRPGLLNRAIFSMSIVIPILAIAIGFALGIPEEAKLGLVLVSISPGTSFPFQWLFRAAREHLYTGALQVTVAFLSIITVPVTIAIINDLLSETVQIDPLIVAQQLLVFQLLPLAIGITTVFVLHQHCAGLIEKNANLLLLGASLLLGVLLIWIFTQQFTTLLSLEMPSITAIGLLAGVSLGMGHWLGGKEPSTRTLLALNLANHNIVLAVFIAITNLSNARLTTVIAVYGLISAGLEIAYFRWNQRRLRRNQRRSSF